MQITVLVLALLIASPAILATKDAVKIIVVNKPNTLKDISQAYDTKLQVEYELAPGVTVSSEGWSLDKIHHSDEEILEFFEPSNSEPLFHDLWFKSHKVKPFQSDKTYHIEYFVNVVVNGSKQEQVFKTVIPVTFAPAVSPIEIIQKTPASELAAVPADQSVTVSVAFNVHAKHMNVTAYKWELDRNYHSESEARDFFHGGNVEEKGTSLIIRPLKKYLLKAKTYHLYFQLSVTNGSNPHHFTFRKDVPVTLVDNHHTDPNNAIKFRLLNDEAELKNVRLDSELTVRVDFAREASDVIISGKGWNLDNKLHNEKEINNFFLPTNAKIEGHDLTIFDKKTGFMPTVYNLYFFVQYQIAGSNKIYEARQPVQVHFINIEDKVDFIASHKTAKGMEDQVTFTVLKQGPTIMEYEVWFVNPFTQKEHIISAGLASETIEDITFRFPYPTRRSEVVPVIFKYQYQTPNSTKQEIRRAITIVRGLNFTLAALKSHMENHPREGREMISVTESIMNMAFNGGNSFKSLRDSTCDESFCSNHGTCQTFAPYYKQCKCNPGHEGARCRFATNGEAHLITELFTLIMERLRTTGSNSASEVIGMVRRISAVPEIFNYTLIEGELGTIALISSSITKTNNITPQIIPAVQSILDMLNNEAHVIWDAKDEAGFKNVQQIEKRLEASLVEIARSAKLENEMFKAMTTFAHRKISQTSIKDKLVDWLNKL